MSFRVAQERDALGLYPVIVIALSALAIVVVAVWVAARLLGDAGRKAHGEPLGTVSPAREGVVEQSPLGVSSPAAAVRQRAESRLSSYGWVDRASGKAHIPIERAIELYVASDGGVP